MLVTCLLLSVTSFVFAQENKSEQAVLKAEQEWEEALLKGDAAKLDGLYAETLIYTHSNGSVDNKKAYIDNIKSGFSKYQSMKREEIKVSIYGTTALVTCRWTVSFSNGENKVSANARYLHAYALENGKWRMVAHQATRIIQ
ncbi:MAG TPA: nuclear transport factor 2 family protein [Blastocatellia bacterium]|nr:nuclear transport factor 2 family protein [Blastocatellia bacterium]